MKIKEFKERFVEAIEKRDRACVYEFSCTEKDCSFFAYVGGSCFLVKCREVNSENDNLLR